MDQELKDSLDQIQRHLEKQQDENQQTRILLERQHDDIRQLAEGMIGTNERLDSFRTEMSIQLDQLKSFISLPYKDLDGRVRLLESWQERSERDPMEIVKERYGRPGAL